MAIFQGYVLDSSNNNPVSGIQVGVFDSDSNLLGYNSTDITGEYVISASTPSVAQTCNLYLNPAESSENYSGYVQDVVIPFWYDLSSPFTISTVYLDPEAPPPPDPIYVTSVELDKSSIYFSTIGSTDFITATVYPTDADDKSISWGSSNTDVCTVSSSGNSSASITSVGVGSATVTVTTTDGGYTASCSITVAIGVTGISLDKETILFNNTDDTETLIATIFPIDATNTNVTWQSSDTNVCNVTSEGVVAPVFNGEATITVTTEDGGFTDTCIVTCDLIGIESNPRLVANASDLNNVRNHLSDYYLQTADIDLSEYENWEPIGTSSSSFSGYYDGNGYKISGLTIDRPTEDYVGLFGDGIVIKGFYNITIISPIITGKDYVGALIGRSYFHDYLENCVIVGGEVNGNKYVGGIFGMGSIQKEIIRCGNIGCSVTATDLFVGGIFGGKIYPYGMQECVNTGNIQGAGYVGGIGGYDGQQNGSTAIMLNCHSVGNVACIPTSGQFTGGTLGRLYYQEVKYSYSAGIVVGDNNVGGLIGDVLGVTITNSYYDSEISGQDDTGKGIPKTTAEMKTQSTYTDWDFTTIWRINESYNNGYPYLIFFAQYFEPAPSLNIYFKQSGSWVQASAAYVKQSGVWVQVNEIKFKQSGAWI